jgi:type II secretory pathway pseudopilin PulG
MELLLVVVIALVAAGLALPRFMKSYQGAKLRTSMRTIIMANRYARGMAVLQQKHTAILFDEAKSQVEIVSVSSGNADRSRFLDQRADRTGLADLDAPADSPDDGPLPSIGSELVRPLAEGVRIVSMEVKSAEERQEFDGIYWVNYYPNGMCDKYTLMLEDGSGKTATVDVDPLSGTAEVTYED